MSRRRHRYAVHEAGHAVLRHHHWRDLPEEHRRVESPFFMVEVYQGEWSGGQVSGCISTMLAFRPWQHLHIDLAGPMAQDGAATSRWILDSPWAWDIENHSPCEKNGGSDYEKVRKFLDDNGMPDEVFTIAVRETAEVLWANRRTVHEVARRAYKVGHLGFWALLDIWPDMADAVAEHERRVARLRVLNEKMTRAIGRRAFDDSERRDIFGMVTEWADSVIPSEILGRVKAIPRAEAEEILREIGRD